MPTFHELSTSQLRQALQLREQIETMQQKLDALLGGGGTGPAVRAKGEVGRPKGKRTMSADARARIAAAATARWARIKGKAAPAKATAKAAPAKTVAKTAPTKSSGLTPEGRAKLAAAMKARWAARKKAASAPAPAAK